MQQLLQDKEPQTESDYLHSDVTNFLEGCPLVIDMADFMQLKPKRVKYAMWRKFSQLGCVISVWHKFMP
ncbi:MAG: hypothetical protein ACXWTT_11490 [Methylobacter sp.]